jgi:hypothetical protein
MSHSPDDSPARSRRGARPKSGAIDFRNTTGLLARSQTASTFYIRFALDPVAEYLAVEDLALRTHASASSDAWKIALKSLEAAPDLQTAFRRIVVVSQFSTATDSRGVSRVEGEHSTEPFASPDAAYGRGRIAGREGDELPRP